MVMSMSDVCSFCGKDILVDDRGVIEHGHTSKDRRREYRKQYYHDVIKHNPIALAAHRKQAREGMALVREKKQYDV